MNPKHKAKKQRATALLASGLTKTEAAAKLQEEFGIGEKAAWALVSNPLPQPTGEPIPPEWLGDWLKES